MSNKYKIANSFLNALKSAAQYTICLVSSRPWPRKVIFFFNSIGEGIKKWILYRDSKDVKIFLMWVVLLVSTAVPVLLIAIDCFTGSVLIGEEISRFVGYSFIRDLLEIDWKGWFKFLDEVSRPYFTLPDDFGDCSKSNDQIQPEPDLKKKPLPEVPKPEVPKPEVPKPEGKKDKLWYVSLTITIFAAACVVIRRGWGL